MTSTATIIDGESGNEFRRSGDTWEWRHVGRYVSLGSDWTRLDPDKQIDFDTIEWLEQQSRCKAT